jgi:hypothetical protein
MIALMQVYVKLLVAEWFGPVDLRFGERVICLKSVGLASNPCRRATASYFLSQGLEAL